MNNYLIMDFPMASAASRELLQAHADLAAAGRHLRMALSGEGGVAGPATDGIPQPELAMLLTDLLGLLPEAVEHIARAYETTASGIVESVDNVHKAEIASAAPISGGHA